MKEDAVPGALVALVADMLGSIAGVTVRKIGWLDDRTSNRALDIRATGWGPSLHERQFSWRQDAVKAHARAVRIAEGEDACEVDADLASSTAVITPYVRCTAMTLGADDIAKALRPCLERIAFVQRSLARTAAAHGIPSPLPKPDGDPPLRDLRHLRIDHRLADLLVHHHGDEGAVVRIRHALGRCLESDSGGSDDSIGAYGPSTNDRQYGVNGFMGTPSIWMVVPIDRTDAARVVCGAQLDRDAATYDGMLLTIGDELPETIVEACTGRPVMDVGETGVPSLDAAVIADAYHDGEGGTCLELAQDEIGVAEHPALGPALARMMVSHDN